MIKSYFLNSVLQPDGSYSPTYGAADINAITKNLVGGGVAPFPSADTYSTTELNDLTASIVGAGTSIDGMKVTKVNNSFVVAQGIAYFENGATVVVDEDGYEIPATIENGYVYAICDTVNNNIDIVAGAEIPTSQGVYTVSLARIENGEPYDWRELARMKVSSDAPHYQQYYDGISTFTDARDGDFIDFIVPQSTSFSLAIINIDGIFPLVGLSGVAIMIPSRSTAYYAQRTVPSGYDRAIFSEDTTTVTLPIMQSRNQSIVNVRVEWDGELMYLYLDLSMVPYTDKLSGKIRVRVDFM